MIGCRCPAQSRSTILFARLAVGTLFALLSINLLADFIETHRITGLLLLVSEVAGRGPDDRAAAAPASSIGPSAPPW